MNHDEYIQLVQASEAFSRLNEDLQQSILKATGEDQVQYIQVFTTEKNGISAAQAELVEKNTKIMKSFDTETKKVKRDYFKSSETHERKMEENETEGLLNSLR